MRFFFSSFRVEKVCDKRLSMGRLLCKVCDLSPKGLKTQQRAQIS